MQNMQKADIKSYTQQELSDFLQSLGEKPFRAKQLYPWLHKKHAKSFEEMTDIPKKLKEKLITTCSLTVLQQADMQQSKLDGTRKYLFTLPDGNLVESVLMHYSHGNSVCISSQVGCRMGCKFCASTLGGLVRNLTPAELLEQVYRIQADTGERVSNVVVMGMGEPLDNYGNVLKFIKLLSDGNGLNISQRSITLSTCGIVPKMRELADEKLQITLALSLHAPTQEKRMALLPVAKKYGIQEAVDACKYYFQQTGRRVTFEYSLVGGANDSGEDARQLGELLSGMNCHVNLIPVNPIGEREYQPPSRKEVLDFKNKLEKYGINVTIRREMGRGIDGACGQLRKRFSERQGEG